MILTRRRFLNLSIASAAGGSVLSPYLIKRLLAQESATPCGPNPGQLACHCPHMIARRQEKFIDACVKESGTKEKYAACLGNMPEICEMLEHPDRDEDGALPPDSCGHFCKLNLCLCNDSLCGPYGEHVPQPKGSQPKGKLKKGKAKSR